MTTGIARTRSRGNPTSGAWLAIDFANGGTDNPQVWWAPNASSQSEIISDYVVPGYYSRSKRGEVFNNPMSYSKVERVSTGTGYGHYKQNSPGTTEYSLSGPLSQFRAQGVDVFNTVRPKSNLVVEPNTLTRAAASIDSPDYSFGEDILELGETIKFLRNPLQSLKELTESVLKKKSSSSSVPKALANSYLTYRFAYSPLVRSVHDALESYDKKPKTPHRRRTSHFRGYDSYSKTATYRTDGTNWFEFLSSWREELSVHASIMYEVRNPIYDWKWRYGLRTKDLPRTLWNVLPYSFMVDRIYDVSSFIQGAMNLTDPSVTMLAANVTTRSFKETSFRLTGESNSGWSISASGELVRDTMYSQSRSPYVGFSLFDIVPRLTPRNLVKDATSIADLSSLLLQRFTGNRR